MATFTLDRVSYGKRILTELQDELETIFKYQLLRSCSADDASEAQALVKAKEDCFEYLRVSVTELYIKHKAVVNKFWTSLDDEGRERVVNADIMNILLCSLVSLKGGEDWISSIYSSNGAHEPCIWEVASMRTANVKVHFQEIEKVLLYLEGDHLAEVYKTQPLDSWKVSKLGMLVDFRRSFLYFFISLFITRCIQEPACAIDICCCCYKSIKDAKVSGSCEGFVYCSEDCLDESRIKHDLLAAQQAAPELSAPIKKQRDIFIAEANTVIMAHEIGEAKEPSPRKKRGRPSRNGSDAQPTTTTTTTTTAENTTDPVIVEEITTTAIIVATPLSTPATTPRQRGRPRKYPKIETPPVVSNTPKKGRGRPRKHPLPIPAPAPEPQAAPNSDEKEKREEAAPDVDMVDNEPKEDKAREGGDEDESKPEKRDETGAVKGEKVEDKDGGDKAEKEQTEE